MKTTIFAIAIFGIFSISSCKKETFEPKGKCPKHEHSDPSTTTDTTTTDTTITEANRTSVIFNQIPKNHL